MGSSSTKTPDPAKPAKKRTARATGKDTSPEPSAGQRHPSGDTAPAAQVPRASNHRETLLPLVDGRALAELADCVVLTIGWDRTPQDVVLRAVDLLGGVHDRVLGTVLTRVDLDRQRFYEPYDGNAYGSPYPYGRSPVGEAAE